MAYKLGKTQENTDMITPNRLSTIIYTLLLVSSLLTGCSSTVKYGDAMEEETTTTEFGSTDLQRISEKMVDSLLSFPPVIQITANSRPILFVERIKNKTTEHIDMESITDTISSRLLLSGKFRFIDMTKVNEVKAQVKYQNESDLVNKDTAVQIGRQIGAEYMLYGNLSSIVKKASSRKDVYFKFTLKLMHLETGIIEWSDEKEIRKTRENSFLGL